MDLTILPRSHRSVRSRRAAGLTFVELIVTLSIFAAAAAFLARTVVSTHSLQRVNRETAIAADAARAMIETLRSEPFPQVFSLFNADPLDDPGGPGSAPGAGFGVERLDTASGDPDGLVGEILFPTVGVGPLAELREDVVDAALGLPRDLNGDFRIDDLDHSDDYSILPVRVRLTWRGVSGERRFELCTALVDYRF